MLGTRADPRRAQEALGEHGMVGTGHRQSQHPQPEPTQAQGDTLGAHPAPPEEERGPGAHGHSRALPQKQLSPVGSSCRALVKMQLL